MLSLSKLERLLSEKGLMISKLFIEHSMVLLIEVLSLENATAFLIHIDLDKYSIPSDGRENSFKIKPFETGVDDTRKLRSTYDVISKMSALSAISKMHSQYDAPFQLKGSGVDEKTHIQMMQNTASRLQLCVNNTSYKVCVCYRNVLCLPDRSHLVKHYVGDPKHRLFFVVSIEVVFANKSVHSELSEARQHVFSVLSNTHDKNLSTFDTLLQHRAGMNIAMEKMMRVKSATENELGRSQALLLEVVRSEKKLAESIAENYVNVMDKKSLQSDIEHSHAYNKHRKDLDELRQLKQKLLLEISEKQSIVDDIYVGGDSALFDNVVALGMISENVAMIESISSSAEVAATNTL